MANRVSQETKGIRAGQESQGRKEPVDFKANQDKKVCGSNCQI